MTTATTSTAIVAAMVPFHCIICFDEFNLTDRPPVVLPCGHTYVCAPCSKRLKVCMECRQPLHFTPPKQQHAPSLVHHYRLQQQPRGHYNGRQRQQQQMVGVAKPQPQVESMPFPIPKNVVLLAMMEAAERQASLLDVDDKEEEDVDEKESSRSSNQQQEEDDADQGELKRVAVGVEALSGSCGTYAVADPEGLAVLPLDPRSRHDSDEKNGDTAEPFVVERGQTVQVVDYTDGVARLARDMGFIVASSFQLVKVQGPLDQLCKLQGMLELVQRRKQDVDQRRQELDRQQQELERLVAGLSEEIQAEQANEPIHPIISPPPMLNPIEKYGSECPRTPSKELATRPMEKVAASFDAEGVELSPAPTSSGNELSPHTIDNSEIALYVDENLPNPIPNSAFPDEIQVGCALFENRCSSMDERDALLSFESMQVSNFLPRADPPRRSDASNDSMIHRDLSASQTSSFDTVDFRTGLSGHRGLSKSQADPRSIPSSRRQIRFMGEHRGVAKLRGAFR